MRRLVLAALLALAACEVSETQLRQVTIESPEALGLSLRELPASALRSSGLAYGLTVGKAGSLAERGGLRPGRQRQRERHEQRDLFHGRPLCGCWRRPQGYADFISGAPRRRGCAVH